MVKRVFVIVYMLRSRLRYADFGGKESCVVRGTSEAGNRRYDGTQHYARPYNKQPKGRVTDAFARHSPESRAARILDDLMILRRVSGSRAPFLKALLSSQFSPVSQPTIPLTMSACVPPNTWHPLLTPYEQSPFDLLTLIVCGSRHVPRFVIAKRCLPKLISITTRWC